MNLTIPDDLLEKNQLSSQLLKQEISLFLLEKFHLSREQATQIAEIPLVEFNQLLEKHKNTAFDKPTTGFGLLKSNRAAVPVDFDPACLLDDRS